MILGAERLRDLVDLAVLLSLPGVIVLAWLVGRLLGVRRSWTTTIASGVIGWIGGVALALAIAGQRKHPETGFTRNVWLFSTFGVMSASVWLELLAKPGALARAQSGLTSIPHPIRAVRRRGRASAGTRRSPASPSATGSARRSVSAVTTRTVEPGRCRWPAGSATRSRSAAACS
jgi:hypothetical protein